MELRLDHFDAAIDARMAASDIPFLNPVTTQQKPVVSKEKLCDWLEDNFDINDSQRAAFAACFAHCCDCIVQSDLPAPVGELVAWSHPTEERKVDFRFLRLDAPAGTKLYAAPLVITLPNPQEDKWLAWSGDHHFRSVAYFKAVKDVLIAAGITIEIDCAGGVIKRNVW
jgi:hypothetical protein